jgi:DNA invertase Pin-like site-specific DNA recombinase
MRVNKLRKEINVNILSIFTGFLTKMRCQMLIGYARVSTDDQNLDLQKDALNKIGCESIFEDRLSGVKDQRPGLQRALDYARSGDTIVVWRLDRLSRSLKNLIEMVNLLDAKEIGLKSIHESIDTSSSSGKLIFHIFGALAEFERNLIQERTQAGLQAARARGRNGGRPKSLTPDQRALAVKLYDEKKHSVGQICQMMEISKPTLYKYIKADKRPIS